MTRGWLAGRLQRNALVCRYAQCEQGGAVHRGHSVCEVGRLDDGRMRIVEHFTWSTRSGSGTNVFDEVPR